MATVRRPPAHRCALPYSPHTRRPGSAATAASPPPPPLPHPFPTHRHPSRPLAGLLELLISHGESKAQPLSLHRVARTTAARRNHYLRVLPLTRSGAPARGALVTLRDSAGRLQVRVIDPGSGYLCQQEPVAHFGLGVHSAVEVVIVWPGGQRRTLTGPAVDEQHVIPFPG